MPEQFDPSSYSNCDVVKTTHIHLQLEADFESKSLKGHVDVTVKLAEDSPICILDSKTLNISAVEDVTDKASPVELKFSLGDAHPDFGQALTVTLQESRSKKGSESVLRIKYTTTPESSAIQWLPPSQTADKKHPYLFTQCQAIHARAMLPCQDSPSLKITYTAEITVPKPLVALMSAVATEEKATDKMITYGFTQKTTMPTYLIALAIGDLHSREVGPRTKVWSEASMVEASAFEFSETEDFLKTAEDLLTPYDWGRYDILVLPPSFPYGGMENPCLTFVTPTLLAGDRSLANVIAHEISHSWMGNLVTSQTWEHFWLNEGFTVFIERKIGARLGGEKMFDFSAIIGWKALQDSVDSFESDGKLELTAMRPKLDGIDPDDAFSSVPYEKGFNFLYYLQKLVGGAEPFEAFLKAYVTKFSGKSITSDDMKEFFLSHFAHLGDEVLGQINWQDWFYKPGMPDYDPKFDTTLADNSQALATKWMSGNAEGAAADLEGWSSGQKVVFLQRILEQAKTLPVETLKKMESAYGFTSSKNSEIRFRWFLLCIPSGYDSVFPKVVEFLKEQGRMKFVNPLFRALAASEKGKEVALKTFNEHKSNYHSIGQKSIARTLGL